MERILSACPQPLHSYLTDSETSDLCINGEVSAFADRGGRLHEIPVKWKESEIRDWCLSILSKFNRTWDSRYPFVDHFFSLEDGRGVRFHICFPPMSLSGVLVSIRKLRFSEDRLSWRKDPAFTQLSDWVREGRTLLIGGPTGCGKTTLLNELLSEISEDERILALEEIPELAPKHPHFINLVARSASPDGYGEVTLRDLLRESLRMRPSRIVLGECRGKEVLELLQVLNTGHAGAMATLHAHSERDILRRVELLCLMASEGRLPVSTIRELIVSGVHALVTLQRLGSIRKIRSIAELRGREKDTILLSPMLKLGNGKPQSQSHYAI